MEQVLTKTPEEVYIDFGAGSCTAACNHCMFGLDKKKEIVTTQQFNLYRLIEAYVEERKAFLSTGLMDPIETFEGDLGFVKRADSIRLSTRNVMTYFRGFELGQGVAKVKSILGSAATVPESLLFSCHTEKSPIRFLNGRDMEAIIWLQLELAGISDADIVFGFRTNRSEENTEQIFQSMQRAARRYRKAMQRIFPQMQVELSSIKDGGLASFCAQAMMGKDSRMLEFGGRFINSKYSQEEVEEVDRRQEEAGLLVLALFPQEVHACHTTMNINDRTLRFSYLEMTEIIQEARVLQVNASILLFKRIKERRERKVLKVSKV